jgi:Zn ribbon nucleic-acid-binding protein
MPLKEQEEPENENCLAGIRCPKCKQQDRFRIVGLCTFEVTDDGSEAVGDHEWDEESSISCPECGHAGKVNDFAK